MRKIDKMSVFAFAVQLAFFLLLIWCLSGCKVGEKAVTKYKASSDFPADCATEFPVTVTQGETITDTIYGEEIDCEEVIRGYTEFWEGVSTENEKERQALADTIAAMLARGEKPPTKYVRCPPSIIRHTTDTIVNKAAEEAANRRLRELEIKYAAEMSKRDAKEVADSAKIGRRTKQRNSLFFINLGLLAAIGGAIYLKMKKRVIA
jgi:hypothetical protein